jgi:hypothetical protein
MFQLFVKNNWLNEKDFYFYQGERLRFPSHLIFKLQWENEIVSSIHVGDQLLYKGSEEETRFTFQLMHVSELTELRVRYKNEEGTEDELISIHFDLALYPTETVLVDLIKRPLFDLLSIYTEYARESGESVIEFDADLMQERSHHLNKSLEEFFKQLEKNDDYLFYRERRQILVLIESIIREPKKKLTDQDQLVHASEATIIGPRTMQHFMQDTSTWSGISFGKPRPNKLLQSYQGESIDLYENRFIYTFIKLVISKIQPLKIKLQQMLENLETNEQDLLFRENQGLITDFERPVLERLTGEKEQLLRLISEVKTYEGQLKKQFTFFRGLKEIRGMVRPNQVLLQNKYYGKLYQFYKNFLNNASDLSSKAPDHIDYLTYYSDFIYLDTIRLLSQLDFYPENGSVQLSINPDPDGYFLTSDPIEHNFRAGDGSPFRIKLNRQALATRENEIARIVISLINIETNETKKIQLLPTLTSFKAETTKDTIMYLYGRQDDVDATYVLYPMETKAEYEAMPYELAHYIYTIGGTYIAPEDREKFGNFKYGIFQYSTHQQLSYDLLLRILKIGLFQIGHHHRCLICHAPGRPINVQNAKYSYECSNSACRVEWGSGTCSNCNGELLKMKAPHTNDKAKLEQDDEQLRNMKAIEWLIMNESKNAKNSLAGICENAYRDSGFFVICPTCGDCQKSKSTMRICQYCEAREKRMQSI